MRKTEQDDSCLKRDIRVELEGGNSLAPWLELLGLGVNVVVKNCSLAWELDCLELVEPPATELHPPVGQLTSQHTRDVTLQYQTGDFGIALKGSAKLAKV